MPGGGQRSPKSILQLFLGRTYILGQILLGSVRSQHILSLRQYYHVTTPFSYHVPEKKVYDLHSLHYSIFPDGFPGSLCTLINNNLPCCHSNLFTQYQGAGMLP